MLPWSLAGPFFKKGKNERENLLIPGDKCPSSETSIYSPEEQALILQAMEKPHGFSCAEVISNSHQSTLTAFSSFVWNYSYISLLHSHVEGCKMNTGHSEEHIPAQIPNPSQWPEFNLNFLPFLSWQLKKIPFPQHDFRSRMSKKLIAYAKFPTLERSGNRITVLDPLQYIAYWWEVSLLVALIRDSILINLKLLILEMCRQ